MSDSTNTAASSTATDTTNAGTGYIPSGDNFAQFLNVSNSTSSGDGDDNAQGVASSDAVSGGQASSSTTDETTDTTATAADGTAKPTEADQIAQAVESDDVSSLPLHLQERGRQIIEQKNRYKGEAETLRTQNAEYAKFASYIEQLRAQGFTSADDVQAALDERSREAQNAQIAQADADREAALLAQYEDEFMDPAAARTATDREMEILRREREAQESQARYEHLTQSIEQRHQAQQYDEAVGAAVIAAPILREFDVNPATGKGFGEELLDELRTSGRYAPDQLKQIGTYLGTRLSAALEAHTTQAATKTAAALKESADAAPPTLGSGGPTVATAAPNGYRPTGDNFALHFRPNRTV